jgi:hypothetical protein
VRDSSQGKGVGPNTVPSGAVIQSTGASRRQGRQAERKRAERHQLPPPHAPLFDLMPPEYQISQKTLFELLQRNGVA